MNGPTTGTPMSTAMRILVNTDTFSPLGGVEHSTLQVSRALHERGHTITLLHAAGPDRPATSAMSRIGATSTNETGTNDTDLRAEWARAADEIAAVPGFTVAAARPWRTLHHLPPAIRAARRCHPDVIWLNRSEQLLWGLGAARSTGAPLVVHLRHHPFAPRLVRLLTPRADRFLAVSRFLADEWIAAGLDPERVEVVPNGIDPARYTPAGPDERAAARRRMLAGQPASVDPSAPVVLHYGRLAADKGVPQLLDAWARSASPGAAGDPGRGASPATLVLVGEPTPEIAAMLRTRIAAHAPTGRPIVHLPRQSDVTGLLHAADLVVLPAVWHEPFGRVVIEAMAAGVPVLATATGGIPEILTGRFADQLIGPVARTGLVPADLVPALAAAIERHLGWRRSLPDLGVAGRAHVEGHFGLDRTADGVEAALHAATRTTTARRPRQEVAA